MKKRRTTSGCKKVSYSKKSHAEAVLQRIMRNGANLSMYVYKCPVCNKFHVGHDANWRN